MDQVFVIAECGSCWRFGPVVKAPLPGEEFECCGGTHFHDDVGNPCQIAQLSNAMRMIVAAKEAGADAAKFQWSSDGRAVAKRRGESEAVGEMYAKYLEYPDGFLREMWKKCDEVGIEFMCTVFLPQDVAVISGLVKRFKVAAKESQDKEFLEFHYPYRKQIIMSHNAHGPLYTGDHELTLPIYCVSRYPTPIEDLKLGRLWCEPTQGIGHYQIYYGLSDHTAHVLTGAVAVGAGARVIESHVRLHDTPAENPDYPHSLMMSEGYDFQEDESATYYGTYDYYVELIRTAERMM